MADRRRPLHGSATLLVVGVLVVGVLVVGVLVGSGDDGPPGGISGPGGTSPPGSLEATEVTFDVAWADDAVRVPAASVADQLVALSPDERVWTFDGDGGGLGDVRPGTPLLLEGYALGVVEEVSTTADGELEVTLGPGQLTDVIDDGTIGFRVDVDLSDARLGYRDPALDPVLPSPPEGATEGEDGGEPTAGPTGDPTGGPTTGGSPGSPAPGAPVQPAGPDMTTTTVPSTPWSTEVSTPPTTEGPDGRGGGGRSRSAPAAGSVAQPPPPPDDEPPDDPGEEEEEGEENADADAPPPEIPHGRSFVTGCTDTGCSVYGSTGSFDFLLDATSRDRATHLTLEAAIRNEELGKLHVRGEATAGRYSGTMQVRIEDGTYTEVTFTPDDLTAEGTFSWSATYDEGQLVGSFVRSVRAKAASAFQKAAKVQLSHTSDPLAELSKDLAAKRYEKALDAFHGSVVQQARNDPAGAAANFAEIGRKEAGVLAGSELVKIPLSVQVPVIVYGVPFVIGWNFDFAVHPALTGNTSTAQGDITFAFSTTRTGEGTPTAKSLTMELEGAPWLIQGIGVDGMGVNVALKATVGIGVFKTQAMGSVGFVFTGDQLSTGGTSMVPCSRTATRATITAGVGVEVLGLDVFQRKVELARVEKEHMDPPGALCS